jgi:hypothetical protein
MKTWNIEVHWLEVGLTEKMKRWMEEQFLLWSCVGAVLEWTFVTLDIYSPQDGKH